MAARKNVDAVNENAKNQEKEYSIGEIVKQNTGIELQDDCRITNDDLELEKFMNEKVLIIIHDSLADDEYMMPMPSVGGVNQLIPIGTEVLVKRKYVEVLARAKTGIISQKTPNPNEPDNIKMIEKNVFAYPFSVIQDDNPNGRSWLKAILNQT